MRKELKRKIAITAISCLAVACVSVGGVSLASASETEDPVWSMENNGAFYMVEGAAVKIYDGIVDGIDGNAMRFLFEMSEGQYENMIENGEYKEGVSVTSYVIAADKIDEGRTTAQEIADDPDVIPTEIPVDKWTEGPSEVKDSKANVWHACAYVYNLPKEYYDDNVASFAVAKISGSTTLYTSVQSRSMSYVADKALESGKYEADRETLEEYLTDKYVWIKNANEPIAVTDFTTGPYIKQTEDYSAFARAHSKWNYKDTEIIENGEVGGIVGAYAKVELAGGQNTNYSEQLNFSLINTMSVETLQAYADMGYTLKLPVYLATNGTNAGETSTVYTLEYDRSSESPTLKTITESSRKTIIQTDAWQEVELNIDDYILMMRTLADTAKENQNRYYYAQVTNASAILNMKIRYGTSASPAWTAYFGEMYLEAPTTTMTTVEGMTVDFYSYIPETEGVYEYYKVENDVYTELKETSIVAGKNDFKIAIVKVADGARTVMNFVDVFVETADEWIVSVNDSISGTKTVTDFTSTEYSKIWSGTTTYFQREHSKNFSYANVSFVSEAYGRTGNIAKFASTKYALNTGFRLYNTMTYDQLRAFAGFGYKMKVDIYIETTATSGKTVRTVQWNEEAQSFNNLSSNATSSTNSTVVSPNTWKSIEISIDDYILLMQTYAISGTQIVPRTYNNDTYHAAMLGVYLQAGETVYLSEMYLEAPKGDITETATEGDTLTLADYKPVEEAFYEYYKFENGVYTAIEESTVIVGANDFQIAVVKVSIVDGKVERTFVKRVDVTVNTEATA